MRATEIDFDAWRTKITGVSNASLTDEELARAFVAGSHGDFARLVDRYAGSLYRVIYRLCGSAEEAEDLVQETFVKVFKALPTLDLDRPLKPWLYKIAVNTTISQLRKRGHRTQLEFDEGRQPVVGDSTEMLAQRVDAQAALARLPLDYRRMIVLRAVEDLAFSEIAEILDIPEATARTRFHRARQMFKTLMGD